MIIKSEIRKIISLPALWGFMALLLIFNTLLAFGGDFSKEIGYINAVTTIAGDEYGSDYLERLESIIPPDKESRSMNDYIHRNMLTDAQNYEGGLKKEYFADEFEGFFQGEWIKDSFLNRNLLSVLENKYEKVEMTAAKKTVLGECESVIFSNQTDRIFSYASDTMGRIMLAECILFSVLAVLFSFTFEQMSNTGLLLYSTKQGRKKLVVSKLAASLTVSTAAFAVIFGTGYGMFFLINDFSSVWNKPISSVNNFAELVSGRFPVVAWNGMTFGGYFIFSTLLGFALMLVFFGFASSLGLLLKDSYIAFGTIAFGAFANIILIFVPPFSLAAFFLPYLFPTGTVFSLSVWFQYGGTSILLPYQETLCTIFWLAISLVMLMLSIKFFVKKDIK